jgi:DNA repair protein RecO (recombination protein O)
VPPVRTPALVLHSFAYGDTSRILRLLTPDFGVRSLLARGALSPKSRFGGVLEPFTEGEAQFNLRENRDLLNLSGFTLIRSRQAIGRDLLAFSGASLAAELVLRFATDEPQPHLFAAVVTALDRLAAREYDPAAASLSAIWTVISSFGFHPSVDSCVGCGRVLAEDEASRFHAELGGVTCRTCRAGRRLVPPAVRHEIATMCTGSGYRLGPSHQGTHAEILDSFLSAHILHGRPLKSLPIFLDMLR